MGKPRQPFSIRGLNESAFLIDTFMNADEHDKKVKVLQALVNEINAGYENVAKADKIVSLLSDIQVDRVKAAAELEKAAQDASEIRAEAKAEVAQKRSKLEAQESEASERVIVREHDVQAREDAVKLRESEVVTALAAAEKREAEAAQKKARHNKAAVEVEATLARIQGAAKAA